MWNNNGYQEYDRGYGPPPGPPGGYGYGPPPFAPPPGEDMNPSGEVYYAERSEHHHHHHHHHHHDDDGSAGYPAPSGYPGQQYQQQYGAPPGPPPFAPTGPPSGYPSSGYGGPPPPQTGYAPPPVKYGPPPAQPHRPPTQEQHYGPSFVGANNQTAHPWFQYSQCTGRRKALCIGVNYIGQQAELKGCINDARNVQRFLIERFGYKEEDVVMLTDDSPHHRQIPTRQNMIEGMQWLVRDAKPHDALFLHYSGHGGQTKDLDGDEDDGEDEVIYPVDFQQAGHIVDDLIHDIVVKPLPPGCRLTAIFDSCHSGSALDLPYIYSTEGKLKEPNLAAEAGQGLLSAISAYSRGDMNSVFGSVSGLLKTASGSAMTKKAENQARRTKTSPADVISWSGCKDSQTSADAFEAGKAAGAMSFAFMSALKAKPEQSYQELLINIREILQKKYSQKPQLSSSHPMDTSLLFIC